MNAPFQFPTADDVRTSAREANERLGNAPEVPFAARFKRPKGGHAAIRLAFIEAYHRCPDCAADGVRNAAVSHAPFDAARDRGLLRRDVNEILETMTLEALS